MVLAATSASNAAIPVAVGRSTSRPRQHPIDIPVTVSVSSSVSPAATMTIGKDIEIESAEYFANDYNKLFCIFKRFCIRITNKITILLHYVTTLCSGK